MSSAAQETFLSIALSGTCAEGRPCFIAAAWADSHAVDKDVTA